MRKPITVNDTFCASCGKALSRIITIDIDPSQSFSGTKTKKLYSEGHIIIETFIGGPLVASIFLSKNFKVLGKENASIASLVIGIVITIVLLLFALMIPESIYENIPKCSLTEVLKKKYILLKVFLIYKDRGNPIFTYNRIARYENDNDLTLEQRESFNNLRKEMIQGIWEGTMLNSKMNVRMRIDAISSTVFKLSTKVISSKYLHYMEELFWEEKLLIYFS